MSAPGELHALSSSSLRRDDAFTLQLRGEMRAGYRRATYLGCCLMLGLIVLDATTVENTGLLPAFISLRFALVFILVALLRLSDIPRLSRHVETFTMLGAYSAGGVIALMSALYLGHESYYYAGISLCLVAIGVLVPIGPVAMATTTAALYITYVLLLLLLDPIPLPQWR